MSPLHLLPAADNANGTLKVLVSASVERSDKPLLLTWSATESATAPNWKSLQAYLQTTLGHADVEVVDFSATASASAPAAAAEKKPAAKMEHKDEKKDEKPRETKIGLEVGKDEDFSLWYQQVLTRSEMLDYYDVSGCYILRPWSYNIWKGIQGQCFFYFPYIHAVY